MAIMYITGGVMHSAGTVATTIVGVRDCITFVIVILTSWLQIYENVIYIVVHSYFYRHIVTNECLM